MSSRNVETFSVFFFSVWHLHTTVSKENILSAKWQTTAAGPAKSTYAREVQLWLEQYFAGRQTAHTFKLNLQGSVFRSQVYSVLQASRYGDTMSYAELALRAGYPRAQRAVGTAMSLNQLPVFIPCHRVLAAHGLGGYTPSLEIKRRLLALEARNFS